MYDKRRLRVCVAALTVGMHDRIAPIDLRNQLLDAQDSYDILTPKRVYGSSPDEWAPFQDHKTIVDYLDEAGFEWHSQSAFFEEAISEASSLDNLVRNVDLYVIDPLVLSLEGDYEFLMHRLDTAIRDRDKAFCIPMPQRMPPSARETVRQFCEARLPLLRVAYESEGRGEWNAESATRLRAYLRRLFRTMQPRPSPETLANVMQVLGQRVPPLQFPESPKMIGGAG